MPDALTSFPSLKQQKELKITITDEPSYESWNLVLDNLPYGNLEQTYEYGEAEKRVMPGKEAVRLLALENDRPVGLIQGLYEKKRGYGRELTVGGPCGYSPVTTLGDEKEETLRHLLKSLEDYTIKNRIIEGFLYWPQRWGFSSIFDDLNYHAEYSFNTYTVPLTKSKSDLWARIHTNKRKNVKKAERAGITVEISESQEDWKSFVGLLKNTSSRAGFDPRLSEVEELRREFRRKGSAKMFIARSNGEPVAGNFVITHRDTAYSYAAASNDCAWAVRPNDLAHWKAMEWACEHGYSRYNMGAFPDPQPSEGTPLWGLWRWKREWRGELEKVSVYSKVYFPRLRMLMDTARRVLRNIPGHV